MEVRYVEPEVVADNWLMFKEEIQKAMDYSAGESTVFDIFRNIMNEQAHVWVVVDEEGEIVNVTVTEFIVYTRYKTLHIITTTGKGWKYYKEAHHALEDFAREYECKSITFWGRQMWEEKLKKLKGKHGEEYETSYLVMQMPLHYER